MEIIFSYLSFEHRYYCSLVCRRWYHAFHLPRVWSTFVFRDRLLSRRKYNLYMGWQYTLDHYRTHIFMSKFAKHIQTLVFSPMLNFFSLFGVMNMLGHFSERNCNFLSQVHTLKFTFSCDMADRTENAIYGTGGQMLKALQDLMDNLEGLCHVELINLLLESSEALYFLDGLCNNCSTKLHSLTLINTTKRPCQLLHPGVFLNLKLLYISPQNLGPDLIWLISHTRLRHLHIVQNTYTEWGVSVDAKVWINMVKQSRQIKVHLSSTGKPKNEIIWQERAPVSSILYESPYSKVTRELITTYLQILHVCSLNQFIQVSPSSVLTIIDLYRNTLETYGHLGQPRFHTSRSFVDRIDSAMITLVKECHKLHTLVNCMVHSLAFFEGFLRIPISILMHFFFVMTLLFRDKGW